VRKKIRAFSRHLWRVLAAIAVMLIALVAAAIVSVLTIDLGPYVKTRAEQEASKRLGRTLEIGELSIRLGRGRFVLEDLRIAGMTPADRPFLEAGRIVLDMPWWHALRRQVIIQSIELSDWEMLIESFPGGIHSFPTLERGPGGERRFTVTVYDVRATRGQFTYEDHATPWITVARNLDVLIANVGEYRGEASFSNGTVQIQAYEPMRAGMRTHFKIQGSEVFFERIDLLTDGAESVVTGSVDLAQWPEQTYRVKSRLQFPRMREIFFANDDFSLFGEGTFDGTFHLFRGGRDLTGRFASDLAGVDHFRFPDLRGQVRWTADRLDVTEASSRFYGGTAQFSFSMGPFGESTPAVARFDARYRDVDLAALTDFLETDGLRLAGKASGRNRLEWPLARFADHRGDGELVIAAPAGVELMTERIPPGFVSDEMRWGPVAGPFDPRPGLGYLPVGGRLAYRFGPEWIDLEPGWMATARTHVRFEGRTAYTRRSRIPFHVASADWQESSRVLAGVLTAFGSPTSAIPIGGFGEFSGFMLGDFRDPRIAGEFSGEQMRAWNVVWGSGRARVVIEDAYAHVSDALVEKDGWEIHASGRFSLGYPRRDGGEEIDARVRLSRRPIVDLRHAFELYDYPVEGRLSGDFHVFGHYERPFGFGRMTIEEGMAYDEPFDLATAGLRFEGEGVRLDAIEITKASGTVVGAAYVGWNGTYSFDADGRRVPVESIAALAYPQAPLSGLLEFSASGSGTFESPRYDVRGRVADLFISDEGIGQVTGRIAVRGELLTLEMEAASPRLAVSGTGRVALTPEADAELMFRFTDTSLDPYVRAFEPGLSPFTTAVASGALRVVGELNHLEHLLVDATVERLDLKLFDYLIRNDGAIKLALDQQVVRLERMRLIGEGTQLDLTGDIQLDDEQIALRATGDANLGILQGFFRDLRSSGVAGLVAQIEGPLDAPRFAGHASITEGRIRHFSLPHSLESVNGRIAFDGSGIQLDGLVGRLGGGEVRFGGRIGLKGYAPDELSLTATGTELRLRYPEGMRSIVDAELALRGDFVDPVLTGTVNVRSAVWSRRFDAAGLDFAATRVAAAGPAAAADAAFPIRYDLRILAPSTLRIDNNTARIVASADLTLRGTYARPLLFGRALIERGEVFFEGNRYFVTRGSIDFANPAKIEPFFDVEAETRVRVPGQTYRIVFHAAGTAEQFVPTLSSDPPLPTIDILSLLFGDIRDPQDAELRALRTPEALEQELVQSRAARLLASPISAGVGRVFEETFGVDTVTITPLLGLDSTQQAARYNPGARLTIGKRISDRVYLTFSRPLTAETFDQLILLEYDQTDRLSWIVSQNEDRTYALDFRFRHSF
jgi:hypothetical protein